MAVAYVNPIPSTVTPERIDQGVDYAGSGNLLALGDGVVTQVNPGGWGAYGNYIAYKLTSGPLAGREIYYAEGVTPHVTVGQKLSAGQIVASLIPGWHSGIEVGYGSGQPDTSYARASGGGYVEGRSTAAGVSFSDLVKQLGGPAGIRQPGTVTGTAPPGATPAKAAPGGGGILPSIGTIAGDVATATVAPFAGAATGPVAGALGSVEGAVTGTVGDAVKAAFNGIFNSVVQHAKYAAVALVLILAAFVMLGKGVSRATHADGAPA